MTLEQSIHPSAPRQPSVVIRCYRLVRRAKTWAFTRFVRRGFAEFGVASSIAAPAGISGAAHVAVGKRSTIGANSVLRVLGTPDQGEVVIRLGDEVSIVGSCTISAYESVEIESGVMFARNVYIADHAHAFRDTTRYVKDQGIEQIAPVRVGAGAWLAENVVVLPGVTIGAGAVVGANAVVRSDIPPFSLAVGVPARVVKSWGPGPADPSSASPS